MKPQKITDYPGLRFLFIKSLVISILITACNTGGKNASQLTVKINNPAQINVKDAVISISDSTIINQVLSFNKLLIVDEKSSLPLQWQFVKNHAKNKIKELLIIADYKAGETKSIVIKEGEPPQFEKRTQAEISVKEGGKWIWVTKSNGNEQYEYKGGEFKNINYLKVPEQHTDHSFFIRYEGPGWESDKVAYRFYLDWRNATDIFGKKITKPVLQNVGLDGFDSYHEPADWGMDILKVGNSLGVGSIGFWDGTEAMRVAETDSVTCLIAENDNLRSKIITNYYGWKLNGIKTDLKSKISIVAGSYLTKQKLFLGKQLDNICTGIVKHADTELINSNGDSEWQYFATWGKQSLAEDNLGMIIFYRKSDLIEITEDGYSYVLVLNPRNQKLVYYFGAVWEQDVSQIKTKDDFVSSLKKQQIRLNSPLKLITENE